MQSSLIIFFYSLSFVLLIPIVLLGILITPQEYTKPILTPKKITPQDLFEQIKNSKESALQALKTFEELFIDARSCDKTVWMELLDQFALCKWLEVTEVVMLQQRIIQANPQLKKEIETHISNSLKNRK